MRQICNGAAFPSETNGEKRHVRAETRPRRIEITEKVKHKEREEKRQRNYRFDTVVNDRTRISIHVTRAHDRRKSKIAPLSLK